MYTDTQSGFYDRLDLEGEQKNQRWLQESPLTELLFFIEYLGLHLSVNYITYQTLTMNNCAQLFISIILFKPHNNRKEALFFSGS